MKTVCSVFVQESVCALSVHESVCAVFVHESVCAVFVYKSACATFVHELVCAMLVHESVCAVFERESFRAMFVHESVCAVFVHESICALFVAYTHGYSLCNVWTWKQSVQSLCALRLKGRPSCTSSASILSLHLYVKKTKVRRVFMRFVCRLEKHYVNCQESIYEICMQTSKALRTLSREYL